MMHANSQEPVAVMFSGGRDSSLAAAYYAEHGRPVHLLTFDHGFQSADMIVRARLCELRRRWPANDFVWNQLSSAKVFRDIALMDLVDDIQHHKHNLVCLGSALAMLARSIDYCRTRGIAVLASGYSGYQKNFPEQSDAAVDFFVRFGAEFGIELRCPGQARKTEQESKTALDALGLSTKALEPTSVWDWTYDENVQPKVIVRYLESKVQAARNFIDLLQQFRSSPDQIAIAALQSQGVS